jgi:hypothetical protein
MKTKASECSAEVSLCGTYRYSLMRRVSDSPRRLAWLMLNPSTADAFADDPTIRKVMGFTRHAGYGYADVVNLFAWRAKDPKECLVNLADAEGARNFAIISDVTATAEAVVCAWGAQKWAREQAKNVVGWLLNHPSGPRDLLYLGRNKDGSPMHPLFVPYGQALTPFDPSTMGWW